MYLVQALFPDNTYGVDSGGDPQVIPKLTFEEFKVCVFTKLENISSIFSGTTLINFTKQISRCPNL